MTSILAIPLLCCGLWTAGQVPAAAPLQQGPAPSPTAQHTAPSPKEEKLSDAERIAHLLRSVDSDRKLLDKLKRDLDDPAGEYHQAEGQFKKLDDQMAGIRKEAQALRDAGKAHEAGQMEGDVQPLVDEWQSARDRFNLAIQERKLVQDRMAALRQKVQQDQQVLDRLTNTSPEPRAAGTPAAWTGKGQAGKAEGEPRAGNAPATQATPAQAGAARPAQAVKQEGTGAAASAQESGPQADRRGANKLLLQAREEATNRAQAADEAKDRLQGITERLEAVRKNIDLENRFQETARKQADQAQEAQGVLNRELKKRLAEKATEEEVQGLLQKIAEAEQRTVRARTEARASADRLGELQAESAAVQAEQFAALREAEQKRVDAERAEKHVADLQNPFSWQNLLRWLFEHGPKALLIAAGILVLRRVIELASRRLEKLMAHHGRRGTREECAHRAETLTGVFRSAASVITLVGGTLMLLDELGVPIVPLVGGAAVFGLAVAFGAQNLIRDYFSGFMVLLEDQYGIGDVIKIGSVSGTVERITLRVTVLRDGTGAVHFIPHGTISTVTNQTHGWSKACFEIDIAYKEDVDYVLGVLLDLARELRREPAYEAMILEDPELGGIASFDDSAVVVKFSLKTRPMKQWAVEGEMLRRIKRRFDELGIEMPYPHRTIYHRMEGNVPPGVVMQGAGGRDTEAA